MGKASDWTMEVEKLVRLAEPYELLDLPDGGVAVLHITSYNLGKATIRPDDGSGPKEVPVLRVYVPKGDKPFYPDYWDITSKRLIAQLMPYLVGGVTGKREFKITKTGKKPTAYFALEVRLA